MIQTPSSCRHGSRNRLWRTLLVFIAAIASLTVVILWVLSVSKSSEVVAWMGAGYAILCLGFLGAQMVAFVKAHMDYDTTVEQPKFDVLTLEEKEWAS